MARKADHNSSDEMEITPEMIEAGVAVLDERVPSAEIGLLNVEKPDVAREVFVAMYRAAIPKRVGW
jgi:hypothetical protein